MLKIKKMKIVRVVTSAHVIPWHLENTLTRLINDFEVCVVGDGVSKFKSVYPDVKFVDIYIDRKINLIADLKAFFCLYLFFKSYKPDIVHSIMHKAALLTAISSFFALVPVRINTFTSQYWATKAGLARFAIYSSDYIVNYLNTACLTDSHSQSRYLAEHHISRNGKPLPVLMKGSLSGVNIDRSTYDSLALEASNLRLKLGLVGGEYIFLFLARKSKDKGIFDLIDAFQLVKLSHPGARLLFVGPDESNGLLKKRKDLNPEIFSSIIEIDQSVDDREVYFAISDILCLPSYREGFGSVVIDAAAQSVPTIGTNIPGLVDAIIDGETGILVPAGSVQELAKAMLDCITNKDKYVSMGKLAKKRVYENFTADLLYASLKSFYFDQTNGSSKRL
jgi:glycosyltransferase involved in cell wall biosynthesis